MGFSRRLPAVVALALGAALASSCAEPDERLDIVYDARFGGATSMDVYLPSDAGTLRPTVMLIHGGAWELGSKDDFQNQARRFARSGYVAASINYRLVPAGAWPNDFQDCECALAYLRLHAQDYGVDPARIVVMGYSAGGHLASLLGVATTDPTLAPDCAAANGAMVAPPAGVISGAGPSDMRSLGTGSTITNYMGGTPDQVPHAYDEASPLFHVAAHEPPFLLIQGSTDWLVNVDASSRMRDALAAKGNDVRFLKLAGGGHLLNPEADPGLTDISIATDSPEGWIAVEDFLGRTIGSP